MQSWPLHPRGAVRWLGATLAAGFTTAVLARLGFGPTAAGMVFLVLVVWTGTQAGMALTLYTAVLCAIAFNFFFLPPVRTFFLASPQEWVAMLTFLASSVAAGRVAERARKQAYNAEQRRAEVERLYELSQEMVVFDDSAALMRELPRIIQRIFTLEGVVLYSRENGRFFSSTSELPMSIEASLSALTLGHHLMQEIPGDITAIPLTLGMRPVGALGWRPAILSHQLATAVGAQVAIALTRASAVEVSARLEALREGERLRTALIDSLTHELRTPLTSIRAAATTLVQNPDLDHEVCLDLAMILDEESARLDRLIGEAVEMAQLDARVVRIHPSPQRPGEFLEQLAQQFQAVHAGYLLALAVKETDKGADKLVWFDPELVGRVFHHLVENATRYCPPGTRIVLGGGCAQDRLEFSVADNGPGIDPSDLPYIFEKFYRGKKRKAKGSGTGMGLAIARAIVTAHGGGMDVASAPDQGTTFRFWVPLKSKEEIPIVDEADAAETAG